MISPFLPLLPPTSRGNQCRDFEIRGKRQGGLLYGQSNYIHVETPYSYIIILYNIHICTSICKVNTATPWMYS